MGHAVAFQGQPLGRTILGPRKNILSIRKNDLQSYIKNNYTADRMVLVGAGGVEHESLVKLAEQHFGGLPSSSPPLSSRLSHIIQTNNLANSFMSFSTSYSDTGLWGIYLVSENYMNLDDLSHFTLKEWQRMTIAPTEAETERAKAQLKASLLLGLDGTTAVAEDIGRQLVTAGRRLAPKEIEAAVDAVTTADIQRVARTYLWDRDIAIAAVGKIEGLLHYSRIRADMASLRF